MFSVPSFWMLLKKEYFRILSVFEWSLDRSSLKVDVGTNDRPLERRRRVS